jgi:hypothetical protein
MSRQKADARTNNTAAVREIHDMTEERRLVAVAKNSAAAIDIRTTEKRRAGTTVFQ